MRKSVCIVGAGAAGLATLKNILALNSSENGIEVEATVFEKSSSIGGIWVWNENDNTENEKATGDSEDDKSAMYSDLSTNLPKEIMRFMDFSPENYECEGKSYVKQPDVLRYLTKYADFFGLEKFIQLNTKVTKIQPILEESENYSDQRNPRWSVTVENVASDETKSIRHEFDYVIICNGHFNKCKYPRNYDQIKKSFKGTIMHSKDYKNPKVFKGKNVVVVGSGPSGIDVSTGAAPFAKHVTVCSKHLKIRQLQNIEILKNFQQKPPIRRTKEKSVILENGDEIECDVIVFCTGYEYDYPCLEQGIVDVQEGGKLVHPLYLHMIHRKFNSLCFIGIPYIALAFFMVDCQSRYYAAYIHGHFSLPSESEMLAHFNEDQLLRKPYGLDGPNSHLLIFLQWPYYEFMGERAGYTKLLQPYVPIFKHVYRIATEMYFEHPLTFRTVTYESILKSPKFLKYQNE